MNFNKLLSSAIVALSMALGGGAQANTIDLAFLMDRSNSIPDADFATAMSSLRTALSVGLADNPQDTYHVRVITFNSTAATVATATIATGTSQADVSNALSGITAPPQTTSGSTCFSCAFNLLGPSTGDFGIINMMTDGNPNRGISSESGLLSIRDDLRDNEGWDSLSFEAVQPVGSGSIDTALLRALAFDTAGTGPQQLITDPNDITDPLNASFVLEVANFGEAYTAAINGKVQAIVTPTIPLPAGVWMLLAGIGAFAAVGRRRKATAA